MEYVAHIANVVLLSMTLLSDGPAKRTNFPWATEKKKLAVCFFTSTPASICCPLCRALVSRQAFCFATKSVLYSALCTTTGSQYLQKFNTKTIGVGDQRYTLCYELGSMSECCIGCYITTLHTEILPRMIVSSTGISSAFLIVKQSFGLSSYLNIVCVMSSFFFQASSMCLMQTLKYSHKYFDEQIK